MNNTELILNEDGSVYHLALSANEISDTIITVGDPSRVHKVSQYFDTIEIKREKREFVTHTGTLKGKRLTVMSTGIGTDNVDIVINELHALKVQANTLDKPYNIIRLGTSGTVQRAMPVDTILISEMALGFDGLLHFYEGIKQDDQIENFLNLNEGLKVLPRPYLAQADKSLLEHFSSIGQVSGVTVTAPGFYAPQGRNLFAKARVPLLVGLLEASHFHDKLITNIEMETAGIYGLASLLGHKAISISAILANRATGEFSTQADVVVDKMIENALKLIVEL